MSSALAPIQSARALPAAGGWQPVCVARLHYHVSWHSRDRNPVLTGERAEVLRAILEEICNERGIRLQTAVVTPRAVHLLVSLRPSQLVASVVRELKGRSALEMFRRCPDLRVALGGNLVWSDRYSLSTVGQSQIPRLVARLESYESAVAS